MFGVFIYVPHALRNKGTCNLSLYLSPCFIQARATFLLFKLYTVSIPPTGIIYTSPPNPASLNSIVARRAS